MSETDPMKRIIITGGSGKAGRYVVREFVDHGYAVLNLDLTHLPTLPTRTLITGPIDAASTRPRPIDAVVHLAAIPAIFTVPDNEVFRTNPLSTYHVLDAASKLGNRKALIASSETTAERGVRGCNPRRKRPFPLLLRVEG
jgi:nucleoside-diphosphate-sugar epimerase